MGSPFWSRRLFFGLSDHETLEHMCVGLNLNHMHTFSHFLEVDLGSSPSSSWVLLPTLTLTIGYYRAEKKNEVTSRLLQTKYPVFFPLS